MVDDFGDQAFSVAHLERQVGVLLAYANSTCLANSDPETDISAEEALGYQAGSTVDAGVVSFPPRMYVAIDKLMRRQMANWCIWFCDDATENLRGKLDLLQPTESTELPVPELSPAVVKLLRQQVLGLLEIRSGMEPTIKLAKHDGGAAVLLAFYRALAGKRGYSSYDETEHTNTEGSSLDHRLSKIVKAKTLHGMDAQDIKIVTCVLWTVAMTAYSNAAEKAARLMDKYRRDTANLADKKSSSAGMSHSDAAMVKSLTTAIEEVADLKTYCERLGGKSETPNLARTKKKRGGSTVTWTMPVDPHGLPSNYPLEAIDSQYKEITVEFIAAAASYGGFWDDKKKTIRLMMFHIPRTVGDFSRTLEKIRATLQHELSHMVQFIMRESLKMRGKDKAADRAGTPFSPRHPSQTMTSDDEGHTEGDDAEKPKTKHEKRTAALKVAYPNASDEDLYFLTPVEFFPQIITWAQRFQSAYGKDALNNKDLTEMWKSYVGLASARETPVKSRFYLTLKKHDQRLWKKAISEGWKRIQEIRPKPVHLSPVKEK